MSGKSPPNYVGFDNKVINSQGILKYLSSMHTCYPQVDSRLLCGYRTANIVIFL